MHRHGAGRGLHLWAGIVWDGWPERPSEHSKQAWRPGLKSASPDCAGLGSRESPETPQVPTGWSQTSWVLLGLHLSLSRNTALHKFAVFLLSTEVHSFVGLPDSARPLCKAPSLALQALTRKCFHSNLGRDVGVLVVIASGVVIRIWAPERGCFQRGGFSQLREGGDSWSQAWEDVWQLEPYFAYLGIQICPDSA